MTNETLRMQMLSGIITEGEYKAKLQENKKKKSLKESMIGGIVGIRAINQIPPRAKADYEMAFEHFLGERYETKFENREQDPYTMEEAEIPAIDPKIANNRAFKDLASYFKQNPNKAEDVKDELSSLEEAYEKDGKYYDEDEYGDKKEVTFKEYLIAKLVKIGLPAVALGFVGALMAGPLGAMAPAAILQAIGIAAGIGGAAGAALDYGETKPIGEVEELEEGKEEVVLSNEILNFLEERGIIDPSDAQKVHTDLISFLNKLSKNPTPDRIRSKSDYIAGIEENEKESN